MSKFYLRDEKPFGLFAVVSGGNVLSPTYHLAMCGSDTAALKTGGFNGSSTVVTDAETFNGVSWASVAGLPAIRAWHGSSGIPTAAIAFGGSTGAVTQSDSSTFDSVAWSAGPAMPANIYFQAQSGVGTQTAALSIQGGRSGVGDWTSQCYLGDGASWITKASATYSARFSAAAGDATAAIAFGGDPSDTNSPLGNSSIYNGVTDSWSAGPNLPVHRTLGSAFGTSTAAFGASGWSGSTRLAHSSRFDGIAFQIANGLLTPRTGFGSVGTTSSAIVAGGYDGSGPAATTEHLAGNPGIYPSSSQAGVAIGWNTTEATRIRKLALTPGDAQVALSGPTLFSSSPQTGLLGMWASDPLEADTDIGSGPIAFSIADSEDSATANFWANGLEIYIWRPATGMKVGTIKAFSNIPFGGTEPTLENSEQVTFADDIAGSVVSALAGDIIVIEVFARHTQSDASSHTATIYYNGSEESVIENAVVSNHASFIEISTETIEIQVTQQVPYAIYDNDTPPEVRLPLQVPYTIFDDPEPVEVRIVQQSAWLIMVPITKRSRCRKIFASD